MYTKKEFPSPYGDFVFQLVNRDTINVNFDSVVSVPLRGFCFSTSSLTNPYSRGKHCFRPLTGILFFNSPSEKPCHS